MSGCLQFFKSSFNYSYLTCCYEVTVYTINCIWNFIPFIAGNHFCLLKILYHDK